jgi:plasmid stabilization system protein ParE
MNELQRAVTDRLRLLSWLRKYKKIQSELFYTAESAGIINQWKRNEDSMRAKFDQWVDNEHMCRRRSEPGYEEYEHLRTSGAWYAWRHCQDNMVRWLRETDEIEENEEDTDA